jgi:hypothetical protein
MNSSKASSLSANMLFCVARVRPYTPEAPETAIPCVLRRFGPLVHANLMPGRSGAFWGKPLEGGAVGGIGPLWPNFFRGSVQFRDMPPPHLDFFKPTHRTNSNLPPLGSLDPPPPPATGPRCVSAAGGLLDLISRPTSPRARPRPIATHRRAVARDHQLGSRKTCGVSAIGVFPD